ncbi:MAG: NYN domain-containing protein, partial [Nanoarchaeota archaeon]
MKRVSMFIDGNNFYYGLRKIYGKNRSLKSFNFKKFADLFAERNKIVGIFYYNAQLDKENNLDKYESQKEFFDKLRQIPNFHLVLCRLLKRNITGTDKHYYIIKEDDINMAVDMVENAYDDKFDVAILVSGDGDFVPAV